MPLVDGHNCPWDAESEVDVGGIASCEGANSRISLSEPVVSVGDYFGRGGGVVLVLTAVNGNRGLPTGENVRNGGSNTDNAESLDAGAHVDQAATSLYDFSHKEYEDSNES
jgi:hypothetical protein